MDRLGHALTRTGRQDETVAVLFLDLDNFKTVNDSLGHKVGDQLLVAAGMRLHENVRPADTVARLGGDEFTLLVEDVRDVTDATALAQRIVEALSRPFYLDGRDVYLTPSVGIALNSGAEGPDDLLRNADLAMYQAKNSGKARYVVYEPSLDRHVWERLQHETELRRALDAGEFTIYYQPVVRLDTGGVAEVEALVRWQHPERGLLPPLDFIPLAEETGVILPMGRGVLEQACAQVAAWRREMPGASDLVLSVNVSPRQFRHPRFADDVRRVLDDTGLPAAALKLEITENAGLDNGDETAGIMRRLKSLGVGIAIDDFGTGYSALSYLRHYPIDTLKLDRLFTGGVDSEEDMAIVRAVIAFANSLDLTVIAEGVETAEQADRLRSLGCPLAQGFHFARPLPTEDAERFLRASILVA
jgi:diguanylate cyclase (GGDEF)-like protein